MSTVLVFAPPSTVWGAFSRACFCESLNRFGFGDCCATPTAIAARINAHDANLVLLIRFKSPAAEGSSEASPASHAADPTNRFHDGGHFGSGHAQSRTPPWPRWLLAPPVKDPLAGLKSSGPHLPFPPPPPTPPPSPFSS